MEEFAPDREVAVLYGKSVTVKSKPKPLGSFGAGQRVVDGSGSSGGI
jgi:hypothetical protein